MKKFRIVLSYLLAVLLFFSALAGLLMSAAYAELRRLPDMAERLADDEYTEKMSDAVNERLRTTLALSALSPEDISDVFDSDTLRRESAEALSHTLRAALGTDEEEYAFESDVLRERIDSLLSDYAEENGIEYDGEGADETYDAVCAAVSAEFSVISSKYISKLASVMAKLVRLSELFWVPLVSAAVLVAAIVLLCGKSRGRAALTVLHSLYFAAFIPSVLFTLLKSRDYLSTTVIAGETLSSLIHRLYVVICGDMSLIAIAASAVFAVFLICTVFIMARRTLVDVSDADCSAGGDSDVPAAEGDGPNE